MKNEQALAAVAFVRTIRYIASRSRMATVTECRAAISALRIVTEEAGVTGLDVENDPMALLFKLDNALTRLDEAKLPEMIDELAEFKNGVLRLYSEGKIDYDDACRLETCTYDSMVCIEICMALNYKEMKRPRSRGVRCEDK